MTLFMHDFPRTHSVQFFLRIGWGGLLGLCEQIRGIEDVIKIEMSFKVGATQKKNAEVRDFNRFTSPKESFGP